MYTNIKAALASAALTVGGMQAASAQTQVVTIIGDDFQIEGCTQDNYYASSDLSTTGVLEGTNLLTADQRETIHGLGDKLGEDLDRAFNSLTRQLTADEIRELATSQNPDGALGDMLDFYKYDAPNLGHAFFNSVIVEAHPWRQRLVQKDTIIYKDIFLSDERDPYCEESPAPSS